jgi:carboxylesterase
VIPDPSPFALGGVGEGGPAVLCLHGLTGTPWEVRPLGDALARAGFACLGPLLPGHGSDPRVLARVPRDAWLREAAQAFDSLAERHPRVYAVGLSMGGLLTLRLCAERAVRGAVVLAAPLRFGAGRRLMIELLAALRVSLPKTPGIADPEARRVHPGSPRMPLPAVRELLRMQTEVEAALPRVQAPLRLIYSRADQTVSPEDAEQILQRVGSGERSVRYLERSNHVLPVDLEREEVARIAVDFLLGIEKNEGGGPGAH